MAAIDQLLVLVKRSTEFSTLNSTGSRSRKTHFRLRSSIFAGNLCSLRFTCSPVASLCLVPHPNSQLRVRSACLLMPGQCSDAKDGYGSDASVVLPFQSVRQVSAADVVLSTKKNAVVTPSKIQSLLDEDDDYDVSDQENRTSDTKPMIKQETPFKLYLTSSPNTTPSQQQTKISVMHQIQNVNQAGRIKKQIDLEDVPLSSIRKLSTNFASTFVHKLFIIEY